MKIISLVFLSVVFALRASADGTAANQVFGGAENLAVLEASEKVEACILRYTPPPDRRAFGDGEKYEETKFVEVSKESAAALRKLLMSDSTYRLNLRSGCWPRYHTRLRFSHADEVVAVDFCFSCKVLLVSRDGKPVGGAVFHDAPSFLTEMKRLFPHDPALANVR